MSGLARSEMLSQSIHCINSQSLSEVSLEDEGLFSISKSRDKHRYKQLNISNTNKAHSYIDNEGTLRSDVLYKTIIRDMRKFFSKDFNRDTLFIKRKRYKGVDYFSQCLV